MPDPRNPGGFNSGSSTSGENPYGVVGGRVILGFGESGSSVQRGDHRGVDVGASTGADIIWPFDQDGTIIQGRRGADPNGYVNDMLVEVRRPGMGGDTFTAYILYGHILSSSVKSSGQVGRGERVAQVGTAADGLGVAHAHIQVWTNKDDALSFNNAAAIDPARIFGLTKGVSGGQAVENFVEDRVGDIASGLAQGIVRALKYIYAYSVLRPLDFWGGFSYELAIAVKDDFNPTEAHPDEGDDGAVEPGAVRDG